MKNILVIDPDPSSRMALREALEGEHRVLEAAGLRDAIDQSILHQPDLIILDMEPHHEYGPDLCGFLKASPATQYIPLILLSSDDQTKHIVDGLHAGAEDYLCKPIHTSELLARIDAHLRTRNFYMDLEKDDLLMLLELTEIISVTRNPQKILHIIVEKMVKAIDVTRCSIICVTDDGDLVVRASSDLREGQEVRLDLSKYPEIARALATRRPVVIQDVATDPLLDPVREQVRDLTDNALFVVPIVKKQHVIGTFFLRTASRAKDGINDRIFKLCQVVANISGNALENAVLFEAIQASKKLLEDLSIRDSLTNLYNHRQFHVLFAEEFSRAERYDTALSCVFVDLDDFKSINDRYGHVTGDVVIKKVATLIQHELRKSDLAARYGGEEFAILLPNTTSDAAVAFAERLLREIGSLCTPNLHGDRVTASIGVATYVDRNLRRYDDLLHRADQAMYRAKDLGKNRCCLAGGPIPPDPFPADGFAGTRPGREPGVGSEGVQSATMSGDRMIPS